MARSALDRERGSLNVVFILLIPSYLPLFLPLFAPEKNREGPCRHADDREGLYFYIVPQSDALGVFFYSIVMHYI